MAPWFAVYTRPRYEKKVLKYLQDKGITVYLPLQRVLRQWSDRRKWVEAPLFSSYLFVQVDEARYFEVLNTPGVVRFITFEGKAVAIPDQQIATIRWLLSSDVEVAELNEKLESGDQVEIIKGPLRGLHGELLRYGNRHRIIVRLSELDKCLEIQLSENHVQKTG